MKQIFRWNSRVEDKFEWLGRKAKTKDDAFPDIENILNECKAKLGKSALDKVNAAVELLKLLSVLHGRDQYCGSNTFIADQTSKAHQFWTIYAELMENIVTNSLDNIQEAISNEGSYKSIFKLSDVYSLIDQLNGLVRTAMDTDSSSDDLFEPFEWTIPVLMVFLEDALQSSEFETSPYFSGPSLPFMVETANAMVAIANGANQKTYQPRFNAKTFEKLLQEEPTEESKLKWHRRNFKFYTQNERDVSKQAYAGNRSDIPIVAAFCILHRISDEGFDLKSALGREQILDLFAIAELRETKSRPIQYFTEWLRKTTDISDNEIFAHLNICKEARELRDSQIASFPMDQCLNNTELLMARLRFVPISWEQIYGPFATFYYRLVKHVVETDQWLNFEGFFAHLNKMGVKIDVRPPGSEYEANMKEIEELMIKVLLRLNDVSKTPTSIETGTTLIFSMLLFNAADEVTDLAPLDVSPGIKHSAMKVFRLIVDLVRSGEIELFQNSSLFRAELREFIRNLSRMADELLPITSDDSRILRERVPADRKSDRAYFIFYMNIAYGFSLTFNEDIVTTNMIESMFKLQPLHYEQSDESIVYEKIQFLSSCGRRVGKIIGKHFEPEILITNFRDLLRCYTKMEFVQQYTPEYKDFNVLYMDKIRFKRGIIEALYAIIANTEHISELKEHQNMMRQLNLITDSFLRENSADLPKDLELLFAKSKKKLK
ncbi:uncharacterized protein LOC129568057 isoform X2 [Sitodiplosis mosellana]|uniref:uncharacterized protein LOC129568057 isoform X2 n=1 Tax=Sitodiplosis mosellana TaxID=263140 RepID=UPI002444DB7B|nr:uncharacterized protein LOC129568057 isoform X2 [Sitodiplosis mosellana]